MIEILLESIGWLGSLLVLVAYFLNMQGWLPSENPWYRWLNIIGSICLIVITLHKQVYQSAVVNIIWAGIGLLALVKRKRG
jgi:hypothetical protein